jgi:hypothetical protein
MCLGNLSLPEAYIFGGLRVGDEEDQVGDEECGAFLSYFFL